jgi:predicted Zn-dependent protease
MSDDSGFEIQEVRMDTQKDTIAQKKFEQAQRELELGNVLAALACLEKALALQDNPLWYSRLGFCVAKERGHLTQAFELCRSAITHDPSNPVHYLYLGKIHLLAGNQNEAIQALRQGATLGDLSEIEKTLAAIGIRKSPVIPAISRNHLLNKYLGILMARLGLR